MSYRNIHLGKEIWKYQIGREFITIKSPKNKKYNINKKDFLKTFETEEVNSLDFITKKKDYSNPPVHTIIEDDDWTVDETWEICPSHIKDYIIDNLMEENQ